MVSGLTIRTPGMKYEGNYDKLAMLQHAEDRFGIHSADR